jgi:hypothetical protein
LGTKLQGISGSQPDFWKYPPVIQSSFKTEVLELAYSTEKKPLTQVYAVPVAKAGYFCTGSCSFSG